MKTSAYHSVWALISLGYGLLFVLTPALVGSLYGLGTEQQLLMMCRYFGIALVGFGMFRWMVRNSVDPSATRLFVTTDLIYCVLLTVLTLHSIVSGAQGSFGWSTVALAIGLACAALSTLRAKSGRFSHA
jgi:hypothetical protein